MITEPHISLFDLVKALSNALDLISPRLVDHHKRVAYVATAIADELGLSRVECDHLLWAGLLHDTGAISLREKLGLLRFEARDSARHGEAGYRLLRDLEELAEPALLIRYHHARWDGGRGAESDGNPVPPGSHLLHLADRIAVLIRDQEPVLAQAPAIGRKIRAQSGKMFVPDMVEAFLGLAAKECFWLDVTSPSLDALLARRAEHQAGRLDLTGLQRLARLFARIIDFKSRFTATHSCGVAASAALLSRHLGFTESETAMMEVAGYLHDLGKLAVPVEILEKPARRTREDMYVIRSHTYHTYHVLEGIGDLDVIRSWAAFHHERLDGNGYPFHLRDESLSLGSRIMATADVFTALVEDRPYRKGLDRREVLRILEEMSAAPTAALDSAVVSVLGSRHDELKAVQLAAQKAAADEYDAFRMG